MPVPGDLRPFSGPSIVTRHIELVGKNTDKSFFKRNPGRSPGEKKQRGLLVVAILILDSFADPVKCPTTPRLSESVTSSLSVASLSYNLLFPCVPSVLPGLGAWAV